MNCGSVRRNFRNSAKLPLKPLSRIVLLHVGLDPRDFLEAELVDLLGRQSERRIFADLGAVISVASGRSRADTLLRAPGT